MVFRKYPCLWITSINEIINKSIYKLNDKIMDDKVKDQYVIFNIYILIYIIFRNKKKSIFFYQIYLFKYHVNVLGVYIKLYTGHLLGLLWTWSDYKIL